MAQAWDQAELSPWFQQMAFAVPIFSEGFDIKYMMQACRINKTQYSWNSTIGWNQFLYFNFLAANEYNMTKCFTEKFMKMQLDEMK